MGWRDVISAAIVGAAGALLRVPPNHYQAPEPVTPTPSYRTRPIESEDHVGPMTRPLAAIRPVTYTAWDVGDDERALDQAENGRLQFAVQLCEAIEADGVASGLLTTRSAGLLRLPMSVTGQTNLVEQLIGDGKSKRSGIFWKMFPHAALARIIRMGILLGAGIGYFVDIDGVPVLHVIEHQYLFQVKDGRGQWRVYYQTQDGDIEITPGDGRWFVFAPYGWERFWIYGAWRAVGKFWLAKLVAVDQRTTWGSKLARGILWVTAPDSSTTAERNGVVNVLASAIAPPVIAMLQGWQLNNIDVQGRGFEVWKDGKEDANNEIRMALSGQLVTSGGQTLGFGAGNIFADIAGSFIDNDAEALAETIHYHGLVPWTREQGETEAPWAEWDTVNPAEKEALGKALKAYGEGVSAATKGHQESGTDARLDIPAYAEKMGVDLVSLETEEDGEIISIAGVKVRIQFPEGSVRNGKNSRGEPWSTLMSGASYGEIVGTEGEDGDPVDAYVGPIQSARSVFVMEQLDELGMRDEFKVFLGFASLEHAQETFRRIGKSDLEGSWIEMPVALFSGVAKGDAPPQDAVLPGTDEQSQTQDTSISTVANDNGGNPQLFAYYLTENIMKVNEARSIVGQPYDERIGEMYPSEWAAYLRAESAKETGVDPGSSGSAAPGAGQVTDDSGDDTTAVTVDIPDVEPVVAEDNEDVDSPVDEAAVKLAEDMTKHKIDRCEHGRVNECPKCGVERERGVLTDEAGNHVGWKIAWRAIKKVPVENVSAEAPKKYEHIDFTPPKGAREEAQRGLDWRKEFGRGGTEVGIARARDISNGESLSPETVRRMKAFFDRHESGAGKGSKPGEDGFPSPWRIAWALWGGDAGYAWARKVVGQMNSADDE